MTFLDEQKNTFCANQSCFKTEKRAKKNSKIFVLKRLKSVHKKNDSSEFKIEINKKWICIIKCPQNPFKNSKSTKIAAFIRLKLIFWENDVQIFQTSNPSKQFSKLTTFTKYTLKIQISPNETQQTSKNMNPHNTQSHCQTLFVSSEHNYYSQESEISNLRKIVSLFACFSRITTHAMPQIPKNYSFTDIFSAEAEPCPPLLLFLSFSPLSLRFRCFRSSLFLSSLLSFS